MTVILGVDPGSRITGWGIVRMTGGRAHHVDCGALQIAKLSLAERLNAIFRGLELAIAEYHPQELAIEKVFMHRNPDSALKLGQARGAAIVAAANQGLEVFEYAPNEIKQAVVGRGHADKQQVQHMMVALLGLTATPGQDAADALAVAVCHGHTRHGLLGIARGRARRAR